MMKCQLSPHIADAHKETITSIVFFEHHHLLLTLKSIDKINAQE